IGVERSGTKLRLWRLADGRELRTVRRAKADPGDIICSPVLDADDQVLAAAFNQALGFFDLDSGRELAVIPCENWVQVRTFDGTEGWVVAASKKVMMWPARRDAQAGVLHVGPPRLLGSGTTGGAAASRDGRFRVIPHGDWALVLDRDRPGRR